MLATIVYTYIYYALAACLCIQFALNAEALVKGSTLLLQGALAVFQGLRLNLRQITHYI
jgi:hypothetical protein